MEADTIFGDPRRCSKHPGVRTSSDNGMHDAPCGRCEHESYESEMATIARECVGCGGGVEFLDDDFCGGECKAKFLKDEENDNLRRCYEV